MHFARLLFAGLLLPVSSYAFSDLSESHPSYTAITYVREQGIVSGYPDGTYQPERTINRAEFTKIVMGSIGDTSFDRAQDDKCFPDVPTSAWFAPYVCAAKALGIIAGYPDDTFGPGNEVNFAEAAKIIVGAFGGDVAPGNPWYKPYVTYLSDRRAIPRSISAPDAPLTRGEMAELIWRLREGVTDQPNTPAMALLPQSCWEFPEESLPNVDLARVRSTWLTWLNDARAAEGLPPYVTNRHLERTAVDWSQFSSERGEMSHKRIGQTEYYDYPMITDWFADRGLVFQNINRVTHSENIGAVPYSCAVADCTDTVINSMREVFDFYMNEKDQDYRPHYNSVMNTQFTMIGLGLALSPEHNKLYLTTHYGTGFANEVSPHCSG